MWRREEARTMPKKTEAIASLNIVTSGRERTRGGVGGTFEEREGESVRVYVCVRVCV